MSARVWPSGAEKRAQVRRALHEDAVRCMRLGWTPAEWEDRVFADQPTVGRYQGHDRVMSREVDAMCRVVWGLS